MNPCAILQRNDDWNVNLQLKHGILVGFNTFKNIYIERTWTNMKLFINTASLMMIKMKWYEFTHALFKN